MLHAQFQVLCGIRFDNKETGTLFEYVLLLVHHFERLILLLLALRAL